MDAWLHCIIDLAAFLCGIHQNAGSLQVHCKHDSPTKALQAELQCCSCMFAVSSCLDTCCSDLDLVLCCRLHWLLE